MAEINQLIFWMGGVMTQSIPALLAESFAKAGRSVNVLALPNFEQDTEELILGKVSDLTYLKKIIEKTKLALEPEKFRDIVLSLARPFPGVVDTIDQLPPSFKRWLIVDYPRSWYDQICGSLGITRCIPAERRIYLSRSNLPQLLPDVFKYLMQVIRVPAKQCLIFDLQSRRSSLALNNGIPSAVFVDAERLKREFLLRKFITQSYKLHTRPAF
jgi:hypothetical protein